MRRFIALAGATIGVLIVIGPAAALAGTPRTDVIIAGSQNEVDYHAESAPSNPAAPLDGASIIGGNIHVVSDRATKDGVAGPCDPDPRPDPHPRPEDQGCDWAEPGPVGAALQDFIAYGRHIQNQLPVGGGSAIDTDVSPDGAYTPVFTETREGFNGRGGLDKDGMLFNDERPVLDDEDLHLRLTSLQTLNYLSPEGNADNRWRRLCGVGRIEQFDNQDPAPPFDHLGEMRFFVVQVWDADLKDPSDLDGGNQDYFIIDIYKADTQFDVARCKPEEEKPPVVDQNPPPNDNVPPPNNVVPPPVVNTPAPPAAAAAPVVIPVAPPKPAQGVQGVITRPRGTARLGAAPACPTTPFAVRVTGRQIRRVTFFVDGKRVGTVTRADRLGRWQTRVDPRKLSVGSHQVRAQVQFRNGSGASRTLRMLVRVCARQVEPNFTG